MTLAWCLVAISLAIWTTIAVLPWRPWGTQEQLDATKDNTRDLSDLTVLIPARNEAPVIEQTLLSLTEQGANLKVIVVDDESTDNTVEVIQRLSLPNVTVIHGTQTPQGWSGKLWALEQGRNTLTTPLVLLLDADIQLLPGTITSLIKQSEIKQLEMISLMASLRMETLIEKLLMPAFIYFFKLLYPFKLSNQDNRRVAAAAGGCILIKAETLNEIGGFATLKNALIDDCALARKVKDHGKRTWLGLTHSAISQRPYNNLGSIWQMVTRTAYTQLQYSPFLLLMCILLMCLAFLIPIAGLLMSTILIKMLGLITILIMLLTYVPILRYYDLSLLWSLSLPLAALLYMLMTIHSAMNHYFGTGANWKGRSYPNTAC